MMKRFLPYFMLLLFPVTAMGQLTGSGTYADPWSGTMAGNATWSGTVYINGDIVVDNERLSVSAGTTVIFVSDGADIRITGTGRLTVNGSQANMARFTADDDNDGNYGESGERWGHITFESMGSAGQSSIDWCIIEYGNKQGSGLEGYGGGLQINFTDVSVSNTVFRYNSAQWGGGLFVNVSQSPAINNCYFLSNTSARGGGGAYFWNGSGSTLTNSVFDSNQSLEPSVSYYTGGGVACQTNTSVKIVNCTFVNNTSTRTEGQALLLHSSPNARVVNSVFWGAAQRQVYCYGTSASVIIFSAYRGITFSSGTPVSPLVLNASNTAADGPNFAATDGSDWMPAYVSPLRDSGTDTYTGVTIPSTDYYGRSRISTTDRGAIESQYSRWKTAASTTDWNTAANWDGGVPSSSSFIFIPSGASNYPTGGTPAVTVGTNRSLTLASSAKATIGSLTNNGSVVMGSDATATTSLIVSSHSGNPVTANLYLEGGGDIDNDNFKWHYISVPFSSVSASVFTPLPNWDFAQFIESRPVFSLSEGWVAYDGYVYSTGQTNGPTFSALTPAKGYNFWDSATNTYTFSGMLNTANYPVSLAFSNNGALSGFNLLGNPYSSGLNWDDIASGTYFPFPSNTSLAVYFTRDNVQCTYLSGVGIPADVTGIIPPMQGFFVKTASTGNTLTIPAAARTHNNIHARYKKSTAAGTIPVVRIVLTDESGSDETVIRLSNQATDGFDPVFDAEKMLTSGTKPNLYTRSAGYKLAINGVSFPQGRKVIPLDLIAATGGSHRITVSQFQGLSGYRVRLADNLLSDTTDLTVTSEYTFEAPAGVLNGRFAVVLESGGPIGIEDTELQLCSLVSFNSEGLLNLKWNCSSPEIVKFKIFVFDLAGRVHMSGKEIELSGGEMTSIPFTAPPGYYIVKAEAGKKLYTSKTIVK